MGVSLPCLNISVTVVLVQLSEALDVASVNSVHQAPTHQYLRTVFDESDLQLRFGNRIIVRQWTTFEGSESVIGIRRLR